MLSNDDDECAGDANYEQSIVDSFFPPDWRMIDSMRGKSKPCNFKDRHANEKDVLEVMIGVRIGEYSFEYGWQKDHIAIVDETDSCPC